MAKNEERFEVDLGRSETFTLVIKHTKQINMSMLQAYLDGTIGWDNGVTEVISKMSLPPEGCDSFQLTSLLQTSSIMLSARPLRTLTS